MKNTANQGNYSLDLRYMQVDVSLILGADLPGMTISDTFNHTEFITFIERSEKGLVCLIRVEFENPAALENDHTVFEILEVKSQTAHSALVKVLFSGPIPLLFCNDEDAWWVSPSQLNKDGMKLTIRGTIKALRRIREDLSKLVGNGFKVKLGEESLKGPEFIDLLPEKQRLVLDKAIEMGYYSRPRGCTQRDIARMMDLKQATVSEHLQSAEAKIIDSISN